ncbi:MAG TPA: class II glutamine amidotransferase [Solirubrobacteraceae bacterium]|nr:class II glutamine amidotransferase [Solirubrobacteraceae bacterium]
MCRWMAWHGQTMRLDALLLQSEHSLVKQSLHSTMGAEPTNGDGFGVGWYGTGDGPGVYRSIEPAWGDANLRHIAAHVKSPLYLAHVRATSGTAIQQSNCHPFNHGRWLFVHNGLINEFARVRRTLTLALDAQSVAELEGSADSELIFHLALGMGLEDDPLAALELTLGFIEKSLRDEGIEPALQASIGVSDGATLWGLRYASQGSARTLFSSEDIDAVRRLHPDNAVLGEFHEGDRIIVSEPLNAMPGAWREFEEGSTLTVHPGGEIEVGEFAPRQPARPL